MSDFQYCDGLEKKGKELQVLGGAKAKASESYLGNLCHVFC